MSPDPADPSDIRQQAHARLDDAALAATAAGAQALPLAWALKDLCYEAWSTEPPRAARAAAALAALQQAGVPAGHAQEVGALVHWTAGIAAVTQGQLPEAVALFDQAAAGLQAAGQADAAAQTQIPKIMALSMLGEHEAATALALATQRALLALGNVGAAARASHNLAGLLLMRDDYAGAARHFHEASVLFARRGHRAQSVLADIGLAAARTSLGDFDEALRIYARARMRAGNEGMALQQALIDESVALLDLSRGRYPAALAGLESARRRFEALGVPQTLAVAEKQLADAYLELRLLPEAWALFDAAVARFAALGMADEQAWALTQRGRAEALQGRPEADASFAQAAALFGHQQHTVGQAAVALARAELALTQADALAGAAAALAWADDAARGFADAAQAEGRARAEVLRAQALRQLGRHEDARAAFDAALAGAQALQQLQVQVRCLTGLGLCALAAGDSALAAGRFEAAIELFEDQRRSLPGDEIRSAFLVDHLRPYQELLRLAAARGDGAQTLRQLDRFRARALDERLQEQALAKQLGDGADQPDSDDAATQPLRDRLNWLYRRVQRLQDEHADAGALGDELRSTERALLEHARRRRLARPAPGAAPSGAPADAAPPGSDTALLDIPALQAALAADEALVAWGVVDEQLLACVLTHDGVRLHRAIAAWPEVLEAVRSARLQLDTLRHGDAPVRQHLAQLTARAHQRLQRLHALVWAPLRADLDGKRRLLLVPHGALGAVPFAALGDGQTTLSQRHLLATVPSARAALRGLHRPPRLPRQVLAFGEPSRLPHTAHEAAFVAGLFPKGQALVGEQATLEALRTLAPQADLLHLACHAQFRSDNPRFSALHLHDGALTVDLAEALALPASTVVLSACETGMAERGAGDETMGLVRGFLVAGAARVLASQWPVDDAVTADFMGRFYRALSAGTAPAAALAEAQAQIRDREPHPYFWAAFSLHGGW